MTVDIRTSPSRKNNSQIRQRFPVVRSTEREGTPFPCRSSLSDFVGCRQHGIILSGLEDPLESIRVGLAIEHRDP